MPTEGSSQHEMVNNLVESMLENDQLSSNSCFYHEVFSFTSFFFLYVRDF